MDEENEVKVTPGKEKRKSPLEVAANRPLTGPERWATSVTPDWLERAIVGAYTGRAPIAAPTPGASGKQGIQRDLEAAGISFLGLPRDLLNVAGQTVNYLSGRAPGQRANWGDYAFGRVTPTSSAGSDVMSLSDYSTPTTQTAQEEPFVDWYAQAQALLGGGPDYGAYRQALTDQAASLNAQIQAMYNQLGEQAGANVARLQDIYGGAQAGVGDIYSSAAGNVEQAYQSAQQQAADQLARLGIEEAAAQTIPFTASQQAQALAGLEQGRAGGLSALQRYGASAQDFGSQMAQVAQQQGTEMNAALLNSLQRMLAESLGAEAQGAYDARLRAPGLARDLYEASQVGRQQPLSIEDQLALDTAASRQAQASADYFVQIGRLRNETLQTLLDAGYDYEEALAEVNLQYPMPSM